MKKRKKREKKKNKKKKTKGFRLWEKTRGPIAQGRPVPTRAKAPPAEICDNTDHSHDCFPLKKILCHTKWSEENSSTTESGIKNKTQFPSTGRLKGVSPIALQVDKRFHGAAARRGSGSRPAARCPSSHAGLRNSRGEANGTGLQKPSQIQGKARSQLKERNQPSGQFLPSPTQLKTKNETKEKEETAICGLGG